MRSLRFGNAIFGALTCDGAVDAVDALAVLRQAGGLADIPACLPR